MKRSQLDADMESLRSEAIETMGKMASLCDEFVGNSAEKRYLKKLSREIKDLTYRLAKMRRSTPLYDLSDPDLSPQKPKPKQIIRSVDNG